MHLWNKTLILFVKEMHGHGRKKLENTEKYIEENHHLEITTKSIFIYISRVFLCTYYTKKTLRMSVHSSQK